MAMKNAKRGVIISGALLLSAFRILVLKPAYNLPASISAISVEISAP